MPRASKRPVSEILSSELQSNFALLISSLSSSHDIQHFFQTFLTEEEKVMLTKRLMLHLMLEKGYSALEISTVIGVSAETVRTHRIINKQGDQVFKEIIGKLAAKRKTDEFWRTVARILRPLELSLQARSNMRARRKLVSGDYE